MAFKQKLKSLIGGKQDSLPSPAEEKTSDILTAGAALAKPKNEDKPTNPHEEQEIIDGIEDKYFTNESFDTSLYELEKLPEVVNLDKVAEDSAKLQTQLQAVSRRVSELILQNHPAYAVELQRVMDLQRTLRSAGSLCQNGRRQLAHARESFTIASLGLLANYRKRQQLIGLLKSLRTIKTLQRTDLRLREIMEEEDYCAAIQLCQECQRAASTFRHYKCISELSSKLQDTLETIEEQLDVALSKTCLGFDESHYQKLQQAYRQLGKTQTAMDQLHMHFASSIHNTAFAITLGYVELTTGSGGGLQKRQYADLCKNITIETFIPCLVDLCKALWEIMKSYYKTIKWHEAYDKDFLGDESVEDGRDHAEESFNRGYVNQKLVYGRGRVWQDVQQKVKMFVLATDLSGLKLDDFIYVLDIINRMIEIGEEFCGSKSEALQDSLKQQSLNFFKTHHQIRLDELRMFLEHEAWELCPVKSNFHILQLMEFRFMRKWANSRQLIPETEAKNKDGISPSSAENDNKSYFSLYLDGGNPFERPSEEEEREDVFSGHGEHEDGYGDSDSDSDIPEELKKDYIDEITGEAHLYKQQGRRRSSHKGSRFQKHGPLITNTTLNVLRVMGKYLQMISILKPIAFDVISCMSQLFDFYLFTVYSFFASDSPNTNDKTVNSRLFTTLQRIRDNLIAASNSAGTVLLPETKDLNDKVPAASMSPLVDLTSPSTMYGLAARVVATESLMFLAKQLEYLHPYLEELIPSNRKAFLSQFFSQTVNMAGEVRKPVYAIVSRHCINYEFILQQMGSVKWDVKEIMSQHNTYIDTLLKSFTEFQNKLTELHRHTPLPTAVTNLIWEQCIRHANRMFVEGYGSSKKCSNEGRALMQLDFQQFLTKLDQIVEIRPVPEREYVEAYIKAYYLPENELESWVHDHKEYSNKQLLALVSSVGHLSRKSRQRLVTLVEEMDKNKRL